MELMQLQMLVAASEEKSLQKAADRVHRTPQAVSMAIGKLEDEIGILLFDHASGRGLRLTPAGEVFANSAKRSLAILGEALIEVKAISRGQRDRLRIGANQSIGEYVLPPFTRAFHERHPDIALKLVIGYSEWILSSLRRREVDLALVAEKPRDKELQAELLMTDRLIAIMNRGHRLAKWNSIPLLELGRESLILLTEASELRERVSETFGRFGIPLNLQVETGSLASIKRIVEQNMGIGIVPLLCVSDDDLTNLVVKTIEEFPEDRSLWIVHPLNPSTACQAFIALLKSETVSRDPAGPPIGEQRRALVQQRAPIP